MKKETSKITIICYDNDECTTEIVGNKIELVAAMGALIENEDKNNAFRDILFTAMEVISFKNVIGQLEEISEEISEKTAPKKVAKKKVVKKAAPKKAVKK